MNPQPVEAVKWQDLNWADRFETRLNYWKRQALAEHRRAEKAEAALADREGVDRLKNLVDDWYEHAQNFKAQLADRDRTIGELVEASDFLAYRVEQHSSFSRPGSINQEDDDAALVRYREAHASYEQQGEKDG